MTRPIEADRFASSVEDILDKVGGGVVAAMPQVVQRGVRVGANAWRRNARKKFPKDKVYRKHGKTYTSGAYAKSVRSHILSKSSDHPVGEVGVPSMPGLPHLLEEGHAKVGGGRVPGREHIAPAADEAFDAAYQAAIDAVNGVLR